MKNNLFLILVLIFNFLFSQTKEETIEFLNNKIQVYQLETYDTQHVYRVDKAISDNDKLRVFHRINPKPFYITNSQFNPKEFLEFIVRKTSGGSKWLELHFKNDGVETSIINLYDDEKNPVDLENKITLIFRNETPDKEIDKIQRALKHLFELYGFRENNLFED